jgi:hypothetical protein
MTYNTFFVWVWIFFVAGYLLGAGMVYLIYVY